MQINYVFFKKTCVLAGFLVVLPGLEPGFTA